MEFKDAEGPGVTGDGIEEDCDICENVEEALNRVCDCRSPGLK